MMRLLRFAEFLYGPRGRQNIFEPLLADAQEEISRSRFPALARVRWLLAMIVAMVWYSPRMVALPTSLLTDLIIRGAAFSALAAGLQFAFARAGAPGVPLSFISTLPFMLMPLTWRVRVSELPHQRRRFVACAIGIGGALIIAAAIDAPLTIRAAFATMPLIVSWTGWRLGDPVFDASNPRHQTWTRPFIIAWLFQGSAWLPLAALGHSMTSAYWPGQYVMTLILGAAMYASIVRSRLKASS
jgi:hypothetical protein